MSQGYKLRFDQMKENNPAQSDSEPKDDVSAFFPSEGSMRNFCLVFKEGDMRAFPYAYIVDYTLEIGQEKNKIILELPSKLITLSGYGLTSLYLAFLKQLPQMIHEVDERYADHEGSMVTHILIEKKEGG